MEKVDIRKMVESGLFPYHNNDVVLINSYRDIPRMVERCTQLEGLFFSVVKQGRCTMSFGENTYELGAHDAFGCVSRDILQKSMMSLDFDAYVVFISPSYAEDVAGLVKLDWTLHVMAANNEIIHMDDDEYDQMARYMELLRVKLSQPETPHTQESLRLLLASLAYAIFDIGERKCDIQPRQSFSSAEHITVRFFRMLKDTRRPLLNVNEYARELSITPKYFSTICRSMTGRTASKLITEETVRRAKLLLRDNSLNIKQISGMLGFKNQSHFGRYFRQYVGQSPQQFRSSM